MGKTVNHLSLSINMKSIVMLAVFLAVAAARPQDAEPIKIVKQSQEHDTESGKYTFSFEAENGIKVEESGEQKQIGDEAGTVSKGSFSYPDEGAVISLKWVADENDSRQLEIICPLPHPLLLTLSSSSPT